MKKKKTEHKPPTYGEFLFMVGLSSPELQEEYTSVLRMQKRPEEVCGVAVPENLNHLSYGQLDDLRGLTENDDIPYASVQIILERDLNIYDEDVNVVFGFLNFCTEELKRVNKLFDTLSPTYSAEEKKAGIERLNFGSFGVLDWYAKRMGIINQNDVRSVPWVRIYQCMKNDHETSAFERRLNEVYTRKSKVK